MKKIGFSLAFFSLFMMQMVKAEYKLTVYFIAGQGADARLFNNIELNGNYDVRHILYSTPEKNTSLKDYAKVLAKQNDTSEKFNIVGVSLGGMIATEMSEFLNPEKVIIISSAKCRSELPFQYRFQKHIPIYKILSPKMTQLGARIMQPIVEPDRNNEKETFISMLKDKDPEFLSRTIDMIINWDREVAPKRLIHIHGEKDNTIPIRNIKWDYKIKKGSHMMTLTRGKEVSKLISNLLLDGKCVIDL